jgi:hypothetical protein
MGEEWDKRVQNVFEQTGVKINVDVDNDGRPEDVISPELKVIHSKSKIRYTIVSVSPSDVVLKTPEGDEFLVDKEEFESAYAVA